MFTAINSIITFTAIPLTVTLYRDTLPATFGHDTNGYVYRD
jgi:hypothetical protein